MTKKHLKALAEVLNKEHASRTLCEAIATVCAGTNPAFDRTKFLTACGFGEGRGT